jgi:hypothetical protein
MHFLASQVCISWLFGEKYSLLASVLCELSGRVYLFCGQHNSFILLFAADLLSGRPLAF